MEDLDELQRVFVRWREQRFTNKTITQAALGLGEETGEILRAVLKRDQGIRGTYKGWTQEIKKEAGDVIIMLLDIASMEQFSLLDAAWERFEEIANRDINHDPLSQ